MIRDRKDSLTAEVGRLREKRALSDDTRDRTQRIADDLMESDAWVLLTGGGKYARADLSFETGEEESAA